MASIFTPVQIRTYQNPSSTLYMCLTLSLHYGRSCLVTKVRNMLYQDSTSPHLQYAWFFTDKGLIYAYCLIRREFRDAARVMGNTALFQQMEAASAAIKRDVIFAASLYVA